MVIDKPKFIWTEKLENLGMSLLPWAPKGMALLP